MNIRLVLLVFVATTPTSMTFDDEKSARLAEMLAMAHKEQAL